MKSELLILLKDWLRKLKYSKKTSPYFDKPMEEIFSEIYISKRWGSQTSGPGSLLESTINTRYLLKKILDEYPISSILDIPCGDFNWIRHVSFPENTEYLGADIVPELIQQNQQYAKPGIKFQVMDLTLDPIPKVDLVLVRDCWVHFAYEEIFQSIHNLIQSQSMYLLTTTFTNYQVNYDIQTGDWRPINLQRKPFYFPPPILLQEENRPEQYRSTFRGKSMALYAIKDINCINYAG